MSIINCKTVRAPETVSCSSANLSSGIIINDSRESRMSTVSGLVVLMHRVSYYRPQRSWAKVMFLQVCVILFTGGRGVCLSACWDDTPREQTPQEHTPPWSRHPPPRADTHPLEQTPPGADTPPEQTPPPEQTMAYGQRAAGTHPAGMHSCFFSVVENEEKLSRTEKHYNRNKTARGNSFGFHYVSIVIDSNSR